MCDLDLFRYSSLMSIYVAGINGMVGSAVAELARSRGQEVFGKSSSELNFMDRDATFRELKSAHIDKLVIAASKVGGIGANSNFPVEFLSNNLQIQTNLIDGAYLAGIEKVLFLGSSCIYPKFASQPISEDSLLTGKLEPTNEPYAIAKISGLTLINAYRNQYEKKWISAMPTNLYGPRDNFDTETSHVLPALIRKFHDAKTSGRTNVKLWGDGTPLREFLHVNDLAEACLLLLEIYDDSIALNVGSGREISIAQLAQLVARVTEFEGEITFDTSKPNGTPRKILDSSRIFDLGWTPKIDLENGIVSTYEWFKLNPAKRIT